MAGHLEDAKEEQTMVGKQRDVNEINYREGTKEGGEGRYREGRKEGKKNNSNNNNNKQK